MLIIERKSKVFKKKKLESEESAKCIITNIRKFEISLALKRRRWKILRASRIKKFTGFNGG